MILDGTESDNSIAERNKRESYSIRKNGQDSGRRQDNDDVLFLVDNEKFAVVHLTWTFQRHADNCWPMTQLFETWDDLYKNRILIDKREFE
jgi:hypothetical protein